MAGIVQTVGGVSTIKLGSNLHQKKLTGIGVVLVAYGINNTYESLSPVISKDKISHSGYLRDFYRKAAKIMGSNRDQGDLAYGVSDFTITAFSSVRGLKLKQNIDSLIPKRWFQTPGTGRLFRYTNKDYVPKWETRSPPMKILMGSALAYKATILLTNHGYIYDGE